MWRKKYPHFFGDLIFGNIQYEEIFIDQILNRHNRDIKANAHKNI